MQKVTTVRQKKSSKNKHKSTYRNSFEKNNSELEIQHGNDDGDNDNTWPRGTMNIYYSIYTKLDKNGKIFCVSLLSNVTFIKLDPFIS